MLTPKIVLDEAEASLLLFLESRAVDHGGLFDDRMVIRAEFHTLARWHTRKFVLNGRLGSESIIVDGRSRLNHWCQLSEDAWHDAHAHRRLKAARLEREIGGRRIGLPADDSVPA